MYIVTETGWPMNPHDWNKGGLNSKTPKRSKDTMTKDQSKVIPISSTEKTKFIKFT